jgi:hypothetical protein
MPPTLTRPPPPPAPPVAASRAPGERSVWVVSAANLRNFGDRLGVRLLSHVLPTHARVRMLFHHPWSPPPPDEVPDLLIVGLGGSLYDHVLTPELVELVQRAPCSIGIFGTQYRSAMPRPRLDALLDSLHTWYGRYAEDIALYGAGRPNVRHLGDWLIDTFPMAEPSHAVTIEVGEEVRSGQPLDKLIEFYQSGTQLTSPRLHPLLCGLTAATSVQYFEQAEFPGLGASGKFTSMLRDVFGEDRPPGVFWRVDRAAVRAYKARVRHNVEQLKADLQALLAQPPQAGGGLATGNAGEVSAASTWARTADS